MIVVSREVKIGRLVTAYDKTTGIIYDLLYGEKIGDGYYAYLEVYPVAKDPEEASNLALGNESAMSFWNQLTQTLPAKFRVAKGIMVVASADVLKLELERDKE